MGILSTIAEIWLAVGVALVIFEVVIPGIFLLWLGLAALGTGLLLLLVVLSFGAQVLLFAALAVVSVLFARSRLHKPVPNGLNQPGSGLIGRRAVALGFNGNEGRVHVGDSDWPARLVAGKAEAGSVLVVEGVEDMVLLVRLAQMAEH